jgi:pyruvate dehydrogenase E2 component (dihydrolipoamide acetyltransferase)
VAEPPPAAAAPPKVTLPPRPAPVLAPVAAAMAPGTPGLHHVTPLARRMAQDLGVDVTALRGTGPGGAVTHGDVELAAAAQAAPALAAGGGRLRASPLARRRARELGVELGGVAGRGADGAIHLVHVEQLAAAPGAQAAPAVAAPAPPKAPAPLTGAERALAMRRAIAGRST